MNPTNIKKNFEDYKIKSLKQSQSCKNYNSYIKNENPFNFISTKKENKKTRNKILFEFKSKTELITNNKTEKINKEGDDLKLYYKNNLKQIETFSKKLNKFLKNARKSAESCFPKALCVNGLMDNNLVDPFRFTMSFLKSQDKNKLNKMRNIIFQMDHRNKSAECERTINNTNKTSSSNFLSLSANKAHKKNISSKSVNYLGGLKEIFIDLEENCATKKLLKQKQKNLNEISKKSFSIKKDIKNNKIIFDYDVKNSLSLVNIDKNKYKISNDFIKKYIPFSKRSLEDNCIYMRKLEKATQRKYIKFKTKFKPSTIEKFLILTNVPLKK